MIKTLIVENEPKIAEQVAKQIASVFPDLEIVGITNIIKTSLACIKKHEPELVFLDVELDNGETGFELLKKVTPINFDIIFTTAYNKYAIDAIRCSAIDYLLKPVNEDELKNAIEKFKSKKGKVDSNKIESLFAAWANPGSQQNTIPLPTMEGLDMVTIADIVYCEGESSQSTVWLNDKRKLVISKTLKECEDILNAYRFFRIHKSYLINLNHLKKYLKGQDGTAVMSNGKSLTVSRNVKDKFLERLNMP